MEAATHPAAEVAGDLTHHLIGHLRALLPDKITRQCTNEVISLAESIRADIMLAGSDPSVEDFEEVANKSAHYFLEIGTQL
uniref:Uncharacterized protein n=1 Tax=Mycena chlorophos TaxID=658473 RepID=A0ABQ0M7D7_MYCCL|nr:predicted protein [Mycena chlorophos]